MVQSFYHLAQFFPNTHTCTLTELHMKFKREYFGSGEKKVPSGGLGPHLIFQMVSEGCS